MIISAFAFGGIPEKAVEKAFIETEIYVSPALLEEYRNVPLALEVEGKINHLQLRALLSGIASLVVRAKIVQPRKKISSCRDVEDNMLLECCYEANAKYLITGDRDLHDIEGLPFDLNIVTPGEFIRLKK